MRHYRQPYICIIRGHATLTIAGTPCPGAMQVFCRGNALRSALVALVIVSKDIRCNYREETTFKGAILSRRKKREREEENERERERINSMKKAKERVPSNLRRACFKVDTRLNRETRPYTCASTHACINIYNMCIAVRDTFGALKWSASIICKAHLNCDVVS